MTPADDPNQRADAMFDALNASESDEPAKEAAADEEKIQRIARIHERAETD